MDTQNSFGLEIKEELEHCEQPTDYDMDIKTEKYFETTDNPEINEPVTGTTDAPAIEPQEIHVDNNENTFSSVCLSIKEEVNFNAEVDNGSTLNVELERLPDGTGNDDVEDNDGYVEIKEEQNENLVSYDYPSFEDTGSMDSNDATALGNVETCLQDEVDIKSEHEDNYQDVQKEDLEDIKIESGITVTDTVITPQKISSVNGVPEYKFIMKSYQNLIGGNEVNGVSHDVTCPKTEILDDSNYCNHVMPNDKDIDCKDFQSYQLKSMAGQEPFLQLEDHDDSFQLNSITGNVLTLEQEFNAIYAKKKEISCPKCPKMFCSKYALRSHLSVHQTIENFEHGRIKAAETRKRNQKKKMEEMEKNEAVFEEPRRRPRRDKVSKYKCVCGKVYHRKSRKETCLRYHDYIEPKSMYVVKCTICLKRFKNKYGLNCHTKKYHRTFPCKFCPTEYDTRKTLLKHLQIHQEVQFMEYKVMEQVVKGNQKLSCFMCSKTWTELSELKTHVMTDHIGPYLCPLCKKTFPKIIDFCNHTKTYHPEVEGQSVLNVLEAFSRLVQEWRCEECNLQFLEADKLALHQIEKHSPELKAVPQFHCPDCRRVFVSQHCVASHRRIYHSVEPETTAESKVEHLGIMCLECGTPCKDNNALKSHMRFHSLKRQYPCKYCDFRFDTPEKRKTHLEVHEGCTRYVCLICEYYCGSESKLKKHKISLEHANMKKSLLNRKPLGEKSTSEDKEKNEENARKKKKMEDQGNKSSDSPDSEKVACDDCGDKFASEAAMLEHKQTHPFIEFPNNEKNEENARKKMEDQGNNSSDSPGSEKVACDVCGDKFASEAAMLEHKQTHPFIEFPNNDEPSKIFFK